MNKMIHADEFRLRVLLTNICNKKCNFCLNDFQSKEGKKYASFMDVIDCIRAYGQYMKYLNEKSIITFSGGEPGLHPQLGTILTYAKYYCDVVKLVTNGTALNISYIPYVDSWHVGVTDKNEYICDFKKHVDKIVVQIVVTDDITIDELYDLANFYYNCGIKVKFFVDFFSKDKNTLLNKIEYMINVMPGTETRFTGKQINRGDACLGCNKDCVTLKALWYFPDGTSSTCPQGQKELFDDDSWDYTMEKAYELHKIK